VVRFHKTITPTNIRTINLMITPSAHHIIPAASLTVPLAVLFLASVNALLENGGQAARNAITIANSALCAAVIAAAVVLIVGPFKLVTAEIGGLELSLTFGLLQATLVLIACFTSLLIAKGTAGRHAANSVKDSTARWNISILFLTAAMILSGNVFALAAACIIAAAGVLKLHTTSPGILAALTSSGVTTAG
jgi:hypothetical protein